MLAQHSGPHSLWGEPPWPPGKLLLACVMASLGTGRKQPAPSGLKIAEHYGHTLVFEGKTWEGSVAIEEAEKVAPSLPNTACSC